METAHFAKRMIGFQKALFDNTYSAVSVMQDYSQNMAMGFLKQFPWVTEESRKPFDDSMEFFKSARRDYKNSVDQGYAKLVELTDAK